MDELPQTQNEVSPEAGINALKESIDAAKARHASLQKEIQNKTMQSGVVLDYIITMEHILTKFDNKKD